uniref:Right handed beta helix domain-containing protein n=1 Tax=Coptotermes formosanus TaxID=36987 RepID=R4V1S8_COPFO|nr:hypothetical protein [Coptotermes formosanus]
MGGAVLWYAAKLSIIGCCGSTCFTNLTSTSSVGGGFAYVEMYPEGDPLPKVSLVFCFNCTSTQDGGCFWSKYVDFEDVNMSEGGLVADPATGSAKNGHGTAICFLSSNSTVKRGVLRGIGAVGLPDTSSGHQIFYIMGAGAGNVTFEDLSIANCSGGLFCADHLSRTFVLRNMFIWDIQLPYFDGGSCLVFGENLYFGGSFNSSWILPGGLYATQTRIRWGTDPTPAGSYLDCSVQYPMPPQSPAPPSDVLHSELRDDTATLQQSAEILTGRVDVASVPREGEIPGTALAPDRSGG